MIVSGSIRKPATSPAGRYMLYAIGEILLVVIGILIALQVNEWNKEREIRKLEISTLQELSFALSQDTMILNDAKQRMRSSYNKTVQMLNHIEMKKPYVSLLDTLFMKSYIFHTPTFNKFNTAAFDLLKESGLDIISDQNLRREIVEHYSNHHAIINGWFANVQRLHALQADRLYDNFRIDENLGGSSTMHALDYNQLLNNKSTLNPYYHFKSLILSSIKRFDKFLGETKSLLESINQQIDSIQ